MRRVFLRLLCLVCWTPAPLGAGEPATLRVDCREVVGTIRPLHGVNGSPLCEGGTVDLTEHWRAARIPLARLHDVNWPRPEAVDMHAVFPDPSADTDDPKSYSFAKTDDVLDAVTDAGAGVVYRLGENIEHTPRRYHVAPPADPARWAAACVGVVRHCNEGWADGRKAGIKYWEIWNEPDNRPACWSGTDEDYYVLYEAAATAIKNAFPDVKIGGPAVGNAGDFKESGFEPAPLAAGLIARCRERRLPLDFFSFHTYTNDPTVYKTRAVAVRRWLDAQGFHDAELHLNEWNYLPGDDWSPLLAAGQGIGRRRWYEEMHGPRGAAFVAYVLADLQESPIDAANLFAGDVGPFGLFDRAGVPHKSYHALRAFSLLLDTPRRVKTTGTEAGRTAALAGVAADGSAATLLLANFDAPNEDFTVMIENLPWEGATHGELSLLDGGRDLERVETRTPDPAAGPPRSVRTTLRLPAPGVALLRLTPARPE